MTKLICKKCGAVYTVKGTVAEEMTCFCLSKEFERLEE